jgi:hypothetical protein
VVRFTIPEHSLWAGMTTTKVINMKFQTVGYKYGNVAVTVNS